MQDIKGEAGRREQARARETRTKRAMPRVPVMDDKNMLAVNGTSPSESVIVVGKAKAKKGQIYFSVYSGLLIVKQFNKIAKTRLKVAKQNKATAKK